MDTLNAAEPEVLFDPRGLVELDDSVPVVAADVELHHISGSEAP